MGYPEIYQNTNQYTQPIYKICNIFMQIARTNPEWPFHRWKPNTIKYNLYFKSETWSYIVRMNDYKTFWTLKYVYTITNFLYLFYIFYCDTSNFIFMLHLSKLLPPLWLLQNCHEIFRSNISNMKVPLITRVFVKLSTLHLHPSIHFSLSRRNYTQIKLLKRLTLITTYVFRW